MHQKRFLDLIEPMKSGLFGFAFRMLRNREDARDAVQDLLMKLWNNRKNLETNRNIKTYSYTALYHDCVDRLRRRNRMQITGAEELAEVADPIRIDAEYERSEQIGQIRKAMDELPYKQKVIMELRDFQGFDYDEIAGMMEMTVNAVRVSIARSRATISEKMKEEIRYGTGTY